MSVWNRHDYHGSWPRIVVENAVIGVLYTLGMYFATRRDYQDRETWLGGSTDQQRREVLRAAKTGTHPADPAQRAVAVALLELRLAGHARNRTPNLVVCCPGKQRRNLAMLQPPPAPAPAAKSRRY